MSDDPKFTGALVAAKVKRRRAKAWGTRVLRMMLPGKRRLTGPRKVDNRRPSGGCYTLFHFHGWRWTVPGQPERVIVPAHIECRGYVAANNGGTWSSGPLTVTLATGEARPTRKHEKALPWADCPEARSDLTRACDRSRMLSAPSY